MRRTARSEDERMPSKGLDRPRRARMHKLGMAELAKAASAPRVHQAIGAEGEAVEVAAGDAQHACVPQPMHLTWRPVRLLHPVAQLAMLAVAKVYCIREQRVGFVSCVGPLDY